MIFDSFKKTFFAHLHQTFDIIELMRGDEDNEEEGKASSRVIHNADVVKQRLKKLETFLKEKFTNTWVSVRKAFLDLDIDHDGYISAEDIIRYFGTDNAFSFQELKMLLQVRDSNKRGYLSY